jgi:hypothetical protein
VDPHTLGDFRWMAYQRGMGSADAPTALFLQDPPLG